MWELEQQVEELVNKYIEESEAVCVNADQVGLDFDGALSRLSAGTQTGKTC